jgi:hypothetical protein
MATGQAKVGSVYRYNGLGLGDLGDRHTAFALFRVDVIGVAV